MSDNPAGYPFQPHSPAGAGQPAPPYGDPAGGYPGAGHPYVGYPPPFYAAPRKTNSLALTAMVVSICGVVMCPAVGIVGAIMGHKARAQLRESGEDGDGLAVTGIALGWISAGLFFAAVLFFGILFAIGFMEGVNEADTTY
jgi:hypothetical protein